MLNTDITYTPEEAAAILKLNKNTVYELIKNGEITAKRFGRVYRIPSKSLSFAFTGLDYDLYQAEETDRKKLAAINKELARARENL